MSSSTEIRVPHETVNDDFVTVVEWHAEQGDRVSSGQTVVSIETSKMVMEVEAEADGFLDIVQGPSAEVGVGDLIGRIAAEAPSANSQPVPSEAPQSEAAVGVAEAPVGAKISKKAQALIDQYGVDAAVFTGAGLVKEADVITFLEKQKAEEPKKPSPAEAAADKQEIVERPKVAQPTGGHKGGLMGDAAASARERGKSLPSLAWNYFWRNWLLGNLVRWAPRGVITMLHRWRGVKMGEGCFIDPTSIVETAYPENVTLGNDVRITAGAIIMTHIKAPHYLRESGIVPPVVKPVVLEDHSFVGVNAVVMPGVTIGKASVVASGAVVLQNVPPYTMVAGNPAKVIKNFPRPESDA